MEWGEELLESILEQVVAGGHDANDGNADGDAAESDVNVGLAAAVDHVRVSGGLEPRKRREKRGAGDQPSGDATFDINPVVGCVGKSGCYCELPFCPALYGVPQLQVALTW